MHPTKSFPKPAAALHSVFIQLLSLLPIMEASKRGDTLGDTGWLTEEEERKGADRCLNLSPGADEINPSSKAEMETETWREMEAMPVTTIGCPLSPLHPRHPGPAFTLLR